jgi:thioredoxin 1
MNKFLVVALLSIPLQAVSKKDPVCAPKKSVADSKTTDAVLHNPTPSALKKQIKSGKIVVVDVYADWCGPCKLMSPIIEALAQDADLSQVVFIKVAHDQQELLKGLTAYLPEGKTSVPSIPYFFIFKDGKIVDQFTGSMAQAALKEKILKDKK